MHIWKMLVYSIKLENFIIEWERQSEEAWQNEKRFSKGGGTSENPIPRREIFLKSVDHVKYEGQVRSQHLLFVQFSRSAFKLSCYSQKLQ